ncbi:MAG: hypothetical protein R3C14_24960 [Caldilineaceae bacterium]
MIDLAPGHKIGLVVANSVLLAGGTVGYGEAIHPNLVMSTLGAVVVGPILRQGTAGAAWPRLAETPTGFVLATGLQNRGVNAVVKHFGRQWSKLGCPVIAQIADRASHALAEVVERLGNVAGLAALEWLLPADADAELIRRGVRAIVRSSELPLWLTLPFSSPAALAAMATTAVEAGAVGLVVGQPQPAHLLRPNHTTHTYLPVAGALYGPLAFAPMLANLAHIAALSLPAALIACGGIHTPEQARQALAVGARAIQVDSALWIEPGLPAHLVAALAHSVEVESE